MKIDRMMTIIVILLNRKRITAKELAERFEVSIRTIYRDIDTIDRAGIPIISYSGNQGGFGIMENYKLNHQLLTPNNLCSLLATLKGINSTFEDMELSASIEKLQHLIPENQIDHLKLNMEQIIISMPPWANNNSQKKLVKEIRQAIHISKLITITYQNYKNEITVREIEPMSIVFKGYSWHLYAYCRLRKNFRIFKLSRILQLNTENLSFERRKQSYFDLEEQTKQQENIIHVTLKFSAEVKTRVEDIFPRANIQTLNNGEMIVTTQFPDKEWYFSLILSFGNHVEVLEPEDIRQATASKVKSMFEKYY